MTTVESAVGSTERYVCPFCRQPSDGSGLTCPSCGAPIDVTRSRDDSGWTELPPIPDMTRIQFGHATALITGGQVPIAELDLSGDEEVFFCHHVLLWADPAVKLAQMSLSGAFTRSLGGMPIVMMTATGPGHLAFSQDHCGELVAVPLDDGQAVDVREHQFLTATTNVDYSWSHTNVHYNVREGNDSKRHYPVGQFIDRFQSKGPGLLLLHVPGNVFLRDLADGESLLVQGGALVYKDATVSMQLHLEHLGGSGVGLQGPGTVPWLRVQGPGRIATCSVFGEGGVVYNLAGTSTATSTSW